METIEKSETLKARSRAARDEVAQTLAEAMTDESQELTAPKSVLATALFAMKWTVAVTQTHSAFRKSRKTEEANAAFLALIDQGVLGIKAAMKGSLSG